MIPETETVILVDAYDRDIGYEDKLAAHRTGHLHRAFSVFIFHNTSNDCKLLLQQRHPTKYHCGGLWTNTCCGHPRPGESVIAAGERRLFEEMGIKTTLFNAGAFHYTAHFKNGLTENEYDHVLVGYITDDCFVANEKEVAEAEWLTLGTLLKKWEEFPEHFTPWFKPALDIAHAFIHSSSAPQKQGTQSKER